MLQRQKRNIIFYLKKSSQMIFDLAYLALLVLASTATATPMINSTTLIVGGEEAKVGEFPWIVNVRGFDVFFCGGSIVNAQWVVSAAHCIDDESPYSVVAGDHDISSYDGMEQRRTVEKIVIHPNNKPDLYENDIALLKVSEPFIFNDRVQPVALPASGFEPTMDMVAAGWGTIGEDGPISDLLLKVTVPHVTHEVCRYAYRDFYLGIADSMICAGVLGQGGKDTCQGDSGGPLMCNTGATNFLCGIVSWGSGCARPDYPGVYTQTSNFTEWINKVIRTN